jgi:peptidoglycan-associated lipoprotein
MIRRPTPVALLLLVSLTGLDACRRKAELAPTPSATTSSTSATDNAGAQRRADSLAAANAAQRRADSLAAARAAEANSAGAQAELLNVLRQRILFDYDKDLLRDDATAALDAKAAVLLANPAVSLAITGHTDERGTAEYNLALGQRRAAQVKRYLVAKGVQDGRLTTQSLGDSQPASQGTDEASYQQNRRAEFEVQGSTGALVRPQP